MELRKSSVFFTFLTGCLLLIQEGYGQFLSNNLRFEATILQGCEGMTVKVTNKATLPTGATVLYDSLSDGDNFGFTNDTIFTYNDTTGVFLIVQNIGTTTSSIQDTLEIEVYPPDPPDFRVLNCENRNTSIQIEPDFYAASRIFFTLTDSVDVLAGDPVPVYTYPDTNPRTIRVKGLFPDGANNCGVAARDFSPINNLQAAVVQELNVELVAADTGEITLSYALAPNISYRLDMAENQNTGYISLGLLDEGSSEVLISDLDTENNYYCFRITALDTCNAANNLPSPTVCSINSSLSPENNQNLLAWTTGDNFNQFSLQKNDQGLTTLQGIVSDYEDPDVICGENYCYQISGTTISGAVSRSAINCDTAFSTDIPPPVESLVSTYNGNDINLNWSSPDGAVVKNYQLYRQEEGGNFELISTQTDTSFLDENKINNRQYCYRVKYVNQCDIISEDGNTSCPILLNVVQTEQTRPSLEWTAYQGWIEGVSGYEVEKYDQQGNLIEVVPVGNNLEYEESNQNLEQQVITYRVKALSSDGTESFSNSVTIRFEAIIYWPNAFSPDGQGDPVNETFNFKAAFIRESEMKIYNRWGELVFVSENKEEGWNGNYNGRMAEPGVYIFVAELQDYQNNTYVERGTFILLRKK